MTFFWCASASGGGHGGDASEDMFGQAFVANEVNGTWHTAIALPGTGTSNSNVYSVSCASAGNCSPGGFHSGGRGGVEHQGSRRAHPLLRLSATPPQVALQGGVHADAAGAETRRAPLPTPPH